MAADTRDSVGWDPDVSLARIGERALFPELEAFAYLNHAAVSPASSEVVRGVTTIAADVARRGMGSIGRWRAQRERLRGRLARLIGAEPSDLALVASTTQSVIDVAWCFPWAEGDRVLCLRGEFPTNVTPWQRAAETFGLELVYLEADAFRTSEGLEALERELRAGLRLVAVSAVEFQTGLAMPIAQIAARAHAAGAQVFVDAIQACGVVPIDVEASGVDYLGCGSHKWLMGLEGAGFLYVKRERQAELVPRLAGWLSHEDPVSFLFEGAGHLRYDRPIRTEPAFLEAGALNAIGFVAFEAALAPIEAIGVGPIFEHVQRYHDALEPALVERGFTSERSPDPARRSGILSARPPAGLELAALMAALGERGVACTTPDGRLRFSPHWPNDLAEVPRVIEALDASLLSLRG